MTAMSIWSYGPGLVSTILLWGTLGVATVIRFKSAIDNPKQYWLAIAIGVGINVLIAIETMRGGRVVIGIAQAVQSSTSLPECLVFSFSLCDLCSSGISVVSFLSY